MKTQIPPWIIRIRCSSQALKQEEKNIVKHGFASFPATAFINSNFIHQWKSTQASSRKYEKTKLFFIQT